MMCPNPVAVPKIYILLLCPKPVGAINWKTTVSCYQLLYEQLLLLKQNRNSHMRLPMMMSFIIVTAAAAIDVDDDDDGVC